MKKAQTLARVYIHTQGIITKIQIAGQAGELYFNKISVAGFV